MSTSLQAAHAYLKEEPEAEHRALLKALEGYEGTVVFVSHDRAFLRALATRVLELRPGEAWVYPGSYIEYVESTGREAPGMRVLERG